MIHTTAAPETRSPSHPSKLVGEVLDQRQEIMFRDGSIATLHRVQIRGFTSLTLRATQFDGEDLIVFDLCRVASSLGAMPSSMRPSDIAGTVFQTLRMCYAGVAAFRKKVEANLEPVELKGIDTEVAA